MTRFLADVGALSRAQTPQWSREPHHSAGGLLSSVCPAGTPELSEGQRTELEKQLKAREERLLPMYYQVALRFADLHDTPGRMQEKGVIMVSGTRRGGFAVRAQTWEAKSPPGGRDCSSACRPCPGCCSPLQPSRTALKPTSMSWQRAVAAHQLLSAKKNLGSAPVSVGHPGVEERSLLPLLAAAPAAAGGGGEGGGAEGQQRAEPHAHPVHAAPLVHGDRRSRQGTPSPSFLRCPCGQGGPEGCHLTLLLLGYFSGASPRV